MAKKWDFILYIRAKLLEEGVQNRRTSSMDGTEGGRRERGRRRRYHPRSPPPPPTIEKAPPLPRPLARVADPAKCVRVRARCMGNLFRPPSLPPSPPRRHSVLAVFVIILTVSCLIYCSRCVLCTFSNQLCREETLPQCLGFSEQYEYYSRRAEDLLN